MESANEIVELMEWYHSHCGGDWQHDKRIRIGTLDNPGWSLWINLADTELEGVELERVLVERSDDDWYDYRTEQGAFYAAGGPLNLIELIRLFLGFAHSHGYSPNRS